MNLPVAYKPYHPADKEALLSLMKALYAEDSEGKPFTSDKGEKTIEELSRYPEKGMITLFEIQGKMVGYSIIIFFWSNEYGGNITTIDEIYVVSEYRGQGLATTFIEYLKNQKLRRSVAIELEVTPSNSRAKKLYTRLGFKEADNTHLVYEMV